MHFVRRHLRSARAGPARAAEPLSEFEHHLLKLENRMRALHEQEGYRWQV